MGVGAAPREVRKKRPAVFRRAPHPLDPRGAQRGSKAEAKPRRRATCPTHPAGPRVTLHEETILAASSSAPLEAAAQSTALQGVFLVPRAALDPDATVWLIEGRPVVALAPHPSAEDLVYLTTLHPAALDFLPDDTFEVD